MGNLSSLTDSLAAVLNDSQLDLSSPGNRVGSASKMLLFRAVRVSRWLDLLTRWCRAGAYIHLGNDWGVIDSELLDSPAIEWVHPARSSLFEPISRSPQ